MDGWTTRLSLRACIGMCDEKCLINQMIKGKLKLLLLTHLQGKSFKSLLLLWLGGRNK